MADLEAKRAATQKIHVFILKERGDNTDEKLEQPHTFSPKEEQKLVELGVTKGKGNKWYLPDGRMVLPKSVAFHVLTTLHSQTHWGSQGLVDHFSTKFMTIGLHDLAKQIVQGCLTCLKINKAAARKLPLGGRPVAVRPFSKIQIDFTEFPKSGRYKYVLVLVDHLTHYVEAFPTARATAQTVAKVLLEQIIPRYGVTEVIDSDQGPHFTSKIIKNLTEALGIRWEKHTPWHPQSSGRVERMNGELKKQLAKLTLETKMSWVQCLPLALLNIRAQPRTDIGISPFEMLYGMPYDAGVPNDHPKIVDMHFNKYISELMKFRQMLWEKGQIIQRPPLNIILHQIKPGDWVLIRSWKESTSQPRWEGPYLVLLTTNTSVRTAEKGWTHASRIKGPVNYKEWKVINSSNDGLRLKLTRN